MLRWAAIATMTAIAATSAVAVAPAAGTNRYFKAKPSGISCGAFRLGQRSATVRCDLPFLGSRAAFLHLRGEGSIQRVSTPIHPRNRTVLGPNATGRFGPFTCTSRPTAVSCNAGGHGFTVGRKFQLVF